MIASLHGTILEKTPQTITIDVGGVGYLVSCAPAHIAELEKGRKEMLIIHTHVREDALALYGFRNAKERSLFRQLIGISGVGPKTALTVLSMSAPDQVLAAIQAGDSSVLTKVSGIGRKTAERIIVELREKVGDLSFIAQGPESEVIDGLLALGYTLDEARDAVKQVQGTSDDIGELMKQVLKVLSK